jgi:hypothetical protein
MTLRSTFARLYAEARARETPEKPGESYATLKGGADIRVRILGRKRQVILGRRPPAPVGETEIVTFRRDGSIPDDAERRDYRDRQGWHRVALTWETPTDLWTMPQAELPI